MEGALIERLSRNFGEYALVRAQPDEPLSLLTVSLVNGDEPGVAEWYRPDEDGFSVVSSAPLSAGMMSLLRIRTGLLTDGVPAVFVTGTYGSRQVITDIFAFRSNHLSNIVYNEESGNSDTNRIDMVPLTDINDDDIIDLPRPVRLPPIDYYAEESEDFWRIDWQNYSSAGSYRHLFSTLHNDAGWYFILPDDWSEHLILQRDDRRSSLGERVLQLYYRGPLESEATLLAEFHTLTGGARTSRLSLPGRVVVLDELSEVTVTAALYPPPPSLTDLRDNLDSLKSAVKPILSEWITGETG